MKNWLSGGLLLLLGACVSPDENSEPGPGVLAVVKHGTSFGMCVGLCKSELTIVPTRMELVRQPGGRGNGNGATPKTCQQVLTSPDWAALQTQFDAAAFAREHGRPVAEIAPFLAQVRQLRERMNNCE